jgi:hypothetical protein
VTGNTLKAFRWDTTLGDIHEKRADIPGLFRSTETDYYHSVETILVLGHSFMRPFLRLKADDLVKSRKTPFFVIPDFGELSRVAKAGIQFFQLVTEFLDSGFHRSDDFLRMHQS